MRVDGFCELYLHHFNCQFVWLLWSSIAYHLWSSNYFFHFPPNNMLSFCPSKWFFISFQHFRFIFAVSFIIIKNFFLTKPWVTTRERSDLPLIVNLKGTWREFLSFSLSVHFYQFLILASYMKSIQNYIFAVNSLDQEFRI